jgi:hypothetical protein
MMDCGDIPTVCYGIDGRCLDDKND